MSAATSDGVPRRSVRMSDDEAWDVLAAAHTGIFTTLRRNGYPVTLPVWFVALHREIFVTTPARSKKVARVRHDPRCSFLVESGTRWAELAAVHITGTASRLEEPSDVADAVWSAIAAKYGGFRTDRKDMPAPTARHYEAAGDRVVLRITPEGRMLTWNNSFLGIG